jgi:alkylhydroperoxidase family enzyme
VERYNLVEYEQATPDIREIYDDYLRVTSSTSLPIWVKSLGGNKHLLHAYWERAKGTLAFGDLPLVLKEMIIFVVSVENGSRYCSACHAHAVLQIDKSLTVEDLIAMAEVDEAQLALLPPPFRAALIFAKQVATNSNNAQDEDFISLVNAGFNSSEISELLSAIDLAMMFNSYTTAMKLPIDPEYKPSLMLGISSTVGWGEERTPTSGLSI